MLSNIELFKSLSEQERALITKHCQTHTFRKNCILITEGERSNGFYIILQGQVKVYVSDAEGREAILNIQGPGQHFGELALIDKAPRSASVMTLEECRMLILSTESFQSCLKQYPEISIKLLSFFCERVRALTQRVKDLSMVSVHGRVVLLMTRLAIRDHQYNQLVIRPRPTHQHIADQVGASREMVSRVMKELKQAQHIETRPGKLLVSEQLIKLHDLTL